MNYQEAITKAMKLLAKGNNAAATPEESAAFLAKAQEIIDNYKLSVDDMSDANQKTDDNEPIMDFGMEDPLDNTGYGQYRETWVRRLGWIIASHNQCKTISYRMQDKSITMRIMGRPSDVTAVRYLYNFFKRQIEEIAKPACAGHSGPYRGQFCMGVLDTLNAKLDKDRESMISSKRSEVSGNGLALVRVNNAVARLETRKLEVTKFVEEKLGKLRAGRGFSPKTETGGRAGRGSEAPHDRCQGIARVEQEGDQVT